MIKEQIELHKRNERDEFETNLKTNKIVFFSIYNIKYYKYTKFQ